MKFTESEITYLDSQPLGRIATEQFNGTLQVSPVGFRYNPELETIDIGGFRMTESQKYANVLANGKVAFVVDDLASTSPWRPRCIEIRGTAETVGLSNGDGLIRIHPSRIISFGIDEPDTPAHQMTVSKRNV